jgi:hypothetical protein
VNAFRAHAPNEAVIERLVGAVLLKNNEDLKARSFQADHPTLHAPRGHGHDHTPSNRRAGRLPAAAA